MNQKRKYDTLEEEALDLAIRTKAKILSATYNPMAVVRSCYTLADVLGREGDLHWLVHELNGYPEHDKGVDVKVPNYRIINLITDFSNNPYAIRESIQQLTGYVKRKTINSVRVNYTNFYFKPSQYENIIEQIINRCLVFLNHLTTELQYSGMVQYLMEEVRRQTDERLSNFGDEILAEAQSLSTSLSGDNPADLSKVGHSCRRMLEILADNVFPARKKPYIGKDGKSHPVGQEQYVNRLVAFVDQRTTGSGRSLLITEIEAFASYIDRLNEDICSIEHKIELDKYHVDLAAIRTYLVLSELLSLPGVLRPNIGINRGIMNAEGLIAAFYSGTLPKNIVVKDVPLLGTGKEGDPYRVDLPNFNMLGPSRTPGNVLVLVP